MASIGEIMKLAGKLMFLCMSCFDKFARGGIQPMYAWLADNVDPEANLHKMCAMTPALSLGVEFFHQGLPLIQPRIYHLATVAVPPVVIYSDAE